MSDGETNFQPSKKRAARVQLSRDNPGLDDNEDTSEQESGNFKRASNEVLATRKIVKVRRQQTSSNPSAPAPASNPFAAIRLVPPVEVKSKENKKNDNKNETQSEKEVVEEPKSESNEEQEKNDINDAKDDESKIEPNVEEHKVEDIEPNTTKSIFEEEASVGEKTEKTMGKTAESAPFSSFQQLSSNQNAFSGISGTGFSTTLFSFGSISKDGSPSGSTTGSLFGLKNDQPSFNFGVPNNQNSSIFGTLEPSTALKSEGGKIPTMQEVPVETGEEDEKAVFAADSVLFEFVDGSWKERGKGELKVNVSTIGNGKSRLVMRAKGNYRLILNAGLFSDMKLTNMDKKGITFACVNTAGEGKEGLSTIALKFRDGPIVDEFKAAVMKHKSTAPVAIKTPENSPKLTDE